MQVAVQMPMSFAVDDIIAVGTYDEAIHPVDIVIDFYFLILFVNSAQL